MKSPTAPKTTDAYFHSFSAYIQTGELKHLNAIFPDADDLSKAAVYRNGFLRSCTEALRASYPTIETLVGKEYFDFLAKGYISQHPPRENTFTNYGFHFPAFLNKKRTQHQLNYLSDFALIDQAWLRAYFSEDSVVLSEDDIEAWQQIGNSIEKLIVRLPKSAILLTLRHQVSSLWLVLKNEQKPDSNIQIHRNIEELLVWRDSQDQVNIRVLNTAEIAFLAPLCEGATLAQAAQAALSVEGNFRVVEYFSELLNTDLLTALSTT